MTANLQPENLTPEQVQEIAEGRLLLMDVLGVSPAEMLHHLETALNLIGVNKLDDAERILRGLAALDVRNPAFPSALGSVALLRKNFDEAIQQAGQAIELDGKFVTAFYVRGEALAQVKRSDEAVADFEKAFQLNPGDPGPDARRCRSIYTGLTGKQPPGAPAAAPQAAGAPRPAGAPVAAGAPRPAGGAPRPAGRAPQAIPRMSRGGVAARATQGGAWGRPQAAPTMVSRAGAGGAPRPLRA